MNHDPSTSVAVTAAAPRGMRPALFGALGVGAAALLGVSLGLPRAPQLAPAALEAPPLPAVIGACPEPSERAGNALVTELERTGIARIARYAFVPSEALLALRSLADAESCARLAGDVNAVARIARRASAFHARVERDYRARVLRYEHARRAGRLRSAAVDIEFLLTLLGSHEGELVRALRRDSRALEQASGEEA